MRVLLAVCGGLLLATGLALAGGLAIDNAILETRPLSGVLESAVELWSGSSEDASWMGWQVPAAAGDHVLCCWHRRDRRWQGETCNLEGSDRQFVFSSAPSRTLMDSDRLVILARAELGVLTDLRVYSTGCLLDAGGREVIWLGSVPPEESVAFLGGLAESDTRLSDEALMAVALHESAKAVDQLARLSRESSDPNLRGEALFWLSHNGSPEASRIILQALSEDPDADVREEAIFALSLLPKQEGIPLLLEIIQDRSQPSEVREQAFFWYVQSGDDQALDLIAEILSN